MTYRIVRYFQSPDVEAEVIARGLTLEQAKAHCSHPETSATTATGAHARLRTAQFGEWFDGYTEEES